MVILGAVKRRLRGLGTFEGGEDEKEKRGK